MRLSGFLIASSTPPTTPSLPPSPSCSDPSVWRCQASSAAAGCGSQLLAARGARQLAVRIPSARTNIAAADELEFVGVCSLPPAPMQQQTARQQPLQPASPMDVQQQQQQQPKQHEVVRPRARRGTPPLPPPPPTQQQPAACVPQLHTQHLNLLASLQYQEQCHRQQLAAALPAATTWAAPSYQATHPAAYLRPAASSWQCTWDGAQQQAHAQLQCQQAAPAAAAAAEAASWPFGVPAQQQGGWAFGSVPLPALPPLQLTSTTALAAC